MIQLNLIMGDSVGWPWRTNNPNLPDNYQLAYGRLKSMLKRLHENHQLLMAY